MKKLKWRGNESGFTLIQAIFVLLVMAVLGVAMMRMGIVLSSTSAYALQGARAYQAARSGLEWGAAQASTGASCNGTFNVAGFSVTVSCNSQAFTEGSIGPYNIYRINAVASSASYGSPDFVQRRLQMKVGFP